MLLARDEVAARAGRRRGRTRRRARRCAPARSSAGCAISSRAARPSARVESLPKLIEEASALALVGAKEHGIRVRFDFDPAVDLVLADKVQIQQVVLNLIRNAIDAMARRRRTPRTRSSRSRRPSDDMALRQRRRHRPRDRARKSPTSCSSPSSPPSAPAWASACRSRARSSRRMAGGSGCEPNEGGGAMFGFTLAARRQGGTVRWRREPIVHVIDDDDGARHSLEFLLDVRGLRGALLSHRRDRLSRRRRRRCGRAASSPTCACPDMSGIELVERAEAARRRRSGDRHHRPCRRAAGDPGDEGRASPTSSRSRSTTMRSSPRSATALARAAPGRKRRRPSAKRVLDAHRDALSPREREVIDGLVEGKANKVDRLRPRHQRAHRRGLSRQRDDQDAGRSLSELVRAALGV